MNINNPNLYLSGSIEFAKNPDSWRNKVFKALHKQYNVIIPKAIEPPFEKTEEEYKGWIKESFIMPDMTNVATSKYILVKIDTAVFKGAGTVSEMSLACWLGKDIVYVLDNIEEKDMPGWALGSLANAKKVASINEAIDYYKKIKE